MDAEATYYDGFFILKSFMDIEHQRSNNLKQYFMFSIDADYNRRYNRLMWVTHVQLKRHISINASTHTTHILGKLQFYSIMVRTEPIKRAHVKWTWRGTGWCGVLQTLSTNILYSFYGNFFFVERNIINGKITCNGNLYLLLVGCKI